MNSISLVTNLTNTKTVYFSDLDHLAKLVTENDWSHALFKNEYRNSANFYETQLFTLDVDEGCNLEEAKIIFKKYKHLIVTTRNHQKSKDNRLPCDRFRVILFLQEPIRDNDIYSATWHALYKIFPFVDPSCKDPGRYWFKSHEVISSNPDGDLVRPSIATKVNVLQNILPSPQQNKGVLARSTIQIINEGAVEEGSRNKSIFKAALDCRQQGYSYEETVKILSGKSTLSNNEELRAIKSGWDREPKYPPRSNNSKNDKLPTELWVKDWLSDRNANLDYKSNIFEIDGNEVPFDLLISRLSLDVDNNKLEYNDRKIQHALNIWIDEQRKFVVRDHISKIQFNPAANPETINRFLNAVVGDSKPLDVAVLRQFIWQIKRKLLGLKVGQHLMVILVGKHRGGKTEAIKKFLEPIFQLYMAANDMTVINDERGIKTLNDNYCIFFDEMAKASKVDTDRLKGIISGEYISYRIMRTNQYVSLKNNCTFIGATNNRVRDLIYDPTSARRFYELNTLDVLNHAEINSIPYLEIWQSVDPLAEMPILPYLKDLDMAQESEIRNMCLVEEWLTNWCEIIEGEEHKGWWKPDSLYGNFKKWLEWQNKTGLLPTYNKFLNRIGYFRKKGANSTVDFYVNGKNFHKHRGENGWKYSIKPKDLEYL